MNAIKPLHHPSRERGVALVMAIIMLVVATLVGMAGIRNTSLQERMAANQFDRAIAMQSAEFAMVQAERYLYETPRDTVKANAASVKDCTATNATCEGIPSTTFQSSSAGWTDVPLGDFNKDLQAAANAQYHIQYLGLKNTEANTDTSQSATPPQYGSTGGGSDAMNLTQNAVYLVTVRSSAPSNDSDRSVVALSALIKSN